MCCLGRLSFSAGNRQRAKMGEFPKIRVPFWEVPIIRSIVFGGLYWVPLVWKTTNDRVGIVEDHHGLLDFLPSWLGGWPAKDRANPRRLLRIR